ncbi:MAG TPA: endonuclease/exonuclease/phosphatase family protein [Opitutaceae bacterium]|nr:endonuclease/exonuclease/phosphatase family protein [Opitutaceae bacterium]
MVWCASASAERVRVATYNVENYVVSDRMVEGVYHTSYPKPESEKAALREIIRQLHADIVVLQEMGPPPYLRELQRDLRQEGDDYAFADVLEGSDDVRHLAVLSRRSLVVTKHTDLSFEYFGTAQLMKRGMLELRAKIGKAELTLFVLHLKSRFTDRPDDPESLKRRTAEARASRNRILQLMGDPATSRYAVLGDFNDAPRSKPLLALSRRGKTILAEPLAAADSRGETWTHFFKKEESYSRIDYVLVSPALKNAVVDGRARILDTPQTLLASDHRPLVVEFDVGD